MPLTRVNDGAVIMAADINQIAAAIPALEITAKSSVSSEKPTETNWAGTTKRRRVFMDSFYVDSLSAKDYVDVDVTIVDDTGTPITGVWTSTDYAVTLQVSSAVGMPAIPTSSSGPFNDITNTYCDEPYLMHIIGYKNNNATATVRIFNRTCDMTTPYLVKVDPEGKKIYALYGTTMADMEIRCWDAQTKEFLFSTSLASVAHLRTVEGRISRWDMVRDFTVAKDSSSNEYRIFMLLRFWATPYSNPGQVCKFSMNGALLSESAVEITNTRFPIYYNGVIIGWTVHNLLYANSITSDTLGNIYVSAYESTMGANCTTPGHTVSGLGGQEAAIAKFDDTGKFVAIRTEGKFGGDGFGDHFTYSWVYGISYCPTDGNIYASVFNMHHQATGLDYTVPHPCIRVINTSLNLVATYETDSSHRDGGMIAPIVSGGKKYCCVVNSLMPPTGATWNYTRCETVDSGPNSIMRYNVTDKLTLSTKSTDSSGTQFSGATNRPVSVAATPDGNVYYTVSRPTSGAPQVDCFNGVTGVTGSPLTVPKSIIKAVINTTVVSWANKTTPLRALGTGNLVDLTIKSAAPPKEIGTYISSLIKPDQNRDAVLLRDKPTPNISSIATGVGWGTIAVSPEVWREPSDLKDVSTVAESSDTSTGIRVITTTAAAVCSQQNLGYIPDTPNSLYIPAAWLGKGLTDNLQDDIELICSPTTLPDTTPRYSTSNTTVLGTRCVPVLEARIPRPWQSGDTINVSFNYSSHILYRILAKVYDTRTLKSFVFIQALDSSFVPLQITYEGTPATYSDGSPLYRLDMPLSTLSTSTSTGTALYSVMPDCKTSHQYRKTAEDIASISFPSPEGAQYIRIGFLVGVGSSAREDNVLSYPGESGGMYIRNTSVSVTAS